MNLSVRILMITANVLRIYEVRLNEISNYKQMLVGVSCIYVVMSSKFYENVDRNIK
jgi:hypothetical protein